MNLIIDIGNTSIKVAFFDKGSFVSQKVVLEHELQKELEKVWDGVIVSCVGQKPKVDFSKALVLSSNTKLPITLNYQTPQTVGVDRLAGVIGAQVLFPKKACLVIDLGTCVTYDLVSAEGVFEGGIISPGWQMRLSAMNNFTSALPLLTKSAQIEHTGKSTEGCMQSGAFHGLLHEIEGIISHYSEKIPDLRVVLCGGDAKTFETKLKPHIFVQPNLVLIGLNRILEYHNAD